MEYQNYGNYMNEMLGYPEEQNNSNMYNNTYTEPSMPMQNIPNVPNMANPANMTNPVNVVNGVNPEDFYEQSLNNIDTEELNRMYPEIYGIVYPMISKICNTNGNRKITKDVLDEMVSEIYRNVEAEDTPYIETIKQNTLPPLKNR
jgi:hypothetical protein